MCPLGRRAFALFRPRRGGRELYQRLSSRWKGERKAVPLPRLIYSEKMSIKESWNLDFEKNQSNEIISLRIRYGVGRFYE